MTSSIYNQVSFNDRLNYCLQDKMVLGQDGQKIPEYKDRAEILYYNQCFGDRPALIRQFNEVADRHQNVSKPLFHIVLSLSGHDDQEFSKSRWVDISRECARVLEFDRNQYVSILHKDKPYQHIHIIANRVGFDRKLAKGHFSIYKLSIFRRELEDRYHLNHTVNHADRLSNEEKLMLRKNIRLDRLRDTLRTTLETACDYPEFEKKMVDQGIKVYKNEKGTAYRLDRHVFFRGYEAGYPWKKIEAILQQNAIQKQELQLRLSQQPVLQPKQRLTRQQSIRQQTLKQEDPETPRIRHRISHHF